MKEISLDASPGAVALFLPDVQTVTNIVCSEPSSIYVSIAAPYGFNHRNINIAAVETASSYEMSLCDVYSSCITAVDGRTVSILDNLTTPLLAVPFSIVGTENNSGEKTTSNKALMNVVDNTSLIGYEATPPIISVDLPVTENLRRPISGSPQSRPKTVTLATGKISAEVGTYFFILRNRTNTFGLYSFLPFIYKPIAIHWV